MRSNLTINSHLLPACINIFHTHMAIGLSLGIGQFAKAQPASAEAILYPSLRICLSPESATLRYRFVEAPAICMAMLRVGPLGLPQLRGPQCSTVGAMGMVARGRVVGERYRGVAPSKDAPMRREPSHDTASVAACGSTRHVATASTGASAQGSTDESGCANCASQGLHACMHAGH